MNVYSILISMHSACAILRLSRHRDVATTALSVWSTYMLLEKKYIRVTAKLGLRVRSG